MTSAQVSTAVERAMATHHVTGMAVAVINRAEIVYRGAFGARDVTQKTRLSDSTVMNAGSLAQAMIGYLVMQLVDTRTLNLDTPVSTYLAQPPEGYGAVASDARYARVTLRMLLDHTSGLSRHTTAGADTSLYFQFDPGMRYQYTSDGFDLVGIVVARATTQSLDALLQERVCKPFGMTHTSLAWTPTFASRAATGYDARGAAVTTSPVATARAGGPVYSTLDDMARFVRGILGDARLSLPARAELFKPQARIAHEASASATSSTASRVLSPRVSSGLGWGVFLSPYGPVFFQESSQDGWSSYIMAVDDAKTAVVFLSNSANGAHAALDLAMALTSQRPPSGTLH